MQRPGKDGRVEAGKVRPLGILDIQEFDGMRLGDQPVSSEAGDLAGLAVGCGIGDQKIHGAASIMAANT